jgi:hypothetical protein
MIKIFNDLAVMTSERNDRFNHGHRVAFIPGANANLKGTFAKEISHENPYESYPGGCEYMRCIVR